MLLTSAESGVVTDAADKTMIVLVYVVQEQCRDYLNFVRCKRRGQDTAALSLWGRGSKMS